MFIEAKNDGSGADNWSYKSCNAPVKSSPPTDQHPTFYRPDSLPVARLTVSKYTTMFLFDVIQELEQLTSAVEDQKRNEEKVTGYFSVFADLISFC